MTNSFRISLLGAALIAVLSGCPTPSAVCGDGKVESPEQCDDGNTASGDGCEADCTTPGTGGGGGTEDDGGMGGGAGGGMGGGTGGGMGGGTGGGMGGGTGGGTGGGGGDDGGTGGGGGDDGGMGGGGGAMPVCGNGAVEGFEDCDDQNMTAGDGCENDCTFTPACGNGKREGNESCDDGNLVGGDGCEADCMAFTNTASVKGCAGLNARIPAGLTCDVVAGDTGRLVTGIILTDGVTYVGGQVLIDSTGSITCAGCDCSAETGAASAARLTCPRAVVSPGLINAHDHISYQASPRMRTAERYEHRHDWRRGNDGHTSISSGTNNVAVQIRWAELRQVMSGTTSIAGATYSSTGNPGMLRNLDANTSGQLGTLAGTTGVNSDTFPLGDISGTELTSGCGYPSLPVVAPGTQSWLPHVAEGIETSARNEFVCLTQPGSNTLGTRTSLVHGVGLTAQDIALVGATGTSLVWSPRSNVSLYGDTAAIPVYQRLGVNIALGTDWTISGSMNLLRELQCADSLGRTRFNNQISDEALWRMVTTGGATATGTTASIGRIATGQLGDLAIYKRRAGGFYRSIIDAEPQDVVATIRAGRVLYGDRNVVAAFDTTSQCDSFDVCGSMKAACVRAEFPALSGANAANTVPLLQSANTSTYPLFYCGTTPLNEPSCVPERPATWSKPDGTMVSNVRQGSTTYTAASPDMDKDGIADASDNCPNVFNPVRPMDGMAQADADADGVGDVCDVCPLNANTTTCTMFDPNDRDSDGIPNTMDNCPSVPNPGSPQADQDMDGKGDVCDPCPMVSNPGTAACPTTIYAIKQGTAPLGQPVALIGALVTAVAPSGYYLQVNPADMAYPGPDYSGIFAYSPASGLVAGDVINVPRATPSAFFGQVQLTGTLGALDGGVTVVSQGNTLPTPVVADPADLATNDGGISQRLESVLVQVNNVTVVEVNPAPGPGDTAPNNEFVLDGGLRVNDYVYLANPLPTVGQPYQALIGVLELRNSAYKLNPRSDLDFISGPPTLVGFSPSFVYVREGSTTTLPGPLSVRMSRPVAADTTITLSSDSAAATVPASVVIATGQSSAPVTLTGVSGTDGGVVTLTATEGATSQTGRVRVLNGNDVPRLVSLDPATAAVNAGGVQRFTVGLDLPASGATTVTLSLMPNTLGTAPMTVVVPADALSASFDVSIDAMATGMGTLTATLGGDTLSAALTVQVAPVTNHVVISEVAVLGPQGASDEFVELHNPTNADVDVGGWVLQYRSATGTTWNVKTTLAQGTTIAAGGFFLVTSAATATGYPATGVAPDVRLAAELGLAGAGGHVRIVNASGGEVDRLGYGTGTAPEGTVLTPVHANGGSFERKARANSTAMTMSAGGVDEFLGNPTDTDNNLADFVIRTARNPQNRSSPTE